MDGKLRTIKYRAEQLEAAERLAKVCDGEIKVLAGGPMVKRRVSLARGRSAFITARGWKGHASIELRHVPIGLAEQVLKLVVRGSGEDDEVQV